MVPLGMVKCKTGDARKFGCTVCRAIHFQQTTFGGDGWQDSGRPLSETFKRINCLAAAVP